MAVHPLSTGAPPRSRTRLLGLGTPAAPDEHSLLLLPSGPDRVRRSSPRRTKPSALRCPLSGGERTTSNGTSTPLERASGYNGRLLRRRARPSGLYPWSARLHQFLRISTQQADGRPDDLANG